MSLTPKMLSFAVMLALASTASAGTKNADAVNRAQGLLVSHGAAVKAATNDQFTATDVIVDANGAEHVRMSRSYRGLPMIGADIVVHSRGGQFHSASLTLKNAGRPSLEGKLHGDDAITIAGADFGTGFDGQPTSRKVIYAMGAGKPVLAHEVTFAGTKRNGDPTEMHYFVDANSGRILNKWDMVHTAKPGGGGGTSTTPAVGTGRTLMYGNVTLNTAGSGSSFNMTDTTRGGGAVYDANNVQYSTAARRAVLFTDADNTWGNNFQTDRATVAADAHFGVATTWDFYKNTFGRNGIFNDGKGVKSYVHVGNAWVNAAWYQNAMYYGDGGGSYLPLTSLDIAGHEMSHGVNQATAGLVYSNDSGGLNEANSDIMGTLVEFYANNADDPGDYKVGEEIYVNGTSALRYMWDPNSDGNVSYDCYPAGGLGGVDPHYSSGPANHFFFLLAEGTSGAGMPTSKTCVAGNTKDATGNGSLIGIGRAKAGAIWYRALTMYWTSGTTYPQARAGMMSAAADLYGAGSAEQNAAAAAWSAILVN